MARKLQTIYEYFSNYSLEEVNYVISILTEEERSLINDRYGDDLHNPVTTGRWSNVKSKKFYNKLAPKMARLLESKIYFKYKEELELKQKEQESLEERVEPIVEVSPVVTVSLDESILLLIK